MKQYKIELDDVVCGWLEHIAEATDQTVESVISNGISYQVANLEESALKAFTYRE